MRQIVSRPSEATVPVHSARQCQGLTLHQRAAGVRGRPRAGCRLLPPARHLLPLGDVLGQAAGILHILCMAWPASCHCHLPLTLPACSSGEEPAPGPVALAQETRWLSLIPGMACFPVHSRTGIAPFPGPLSLSWVPVSFSVSDLSSVCVTVLLGVRLPGH